jgi:hypothetical protein
LKISSCTIQSSVYDFNIKVLFNNNVQADTLNYENLIVNGLNRNKYDVKPIKSGDEVIGADITILNHYDYSNINLTVSSKVACENTPNFTLKKDYAYSFTPENLLQVKNASVVVSQGKLSVKASLKNNSAGSLSYSLIGAVYGKNGEMVLSFVESKTLSAGATVEINETRSLGNSEEYTTKLFIWDDMNVMKTIFQQ